MNGCDQSRGHHNFQPCGTQTNGSTNSNQLIRRAVTPMEREDDVYRNSPAIGCPIPFELGDKTPDSTSNNFRKMVVGRPIAFPDVERDSESTTSKSTTTTLSTLKVLNATTDEFCEDKCGIGFTETVPATCLTRQVAVCWIPLEGNQIPSNTSTKRRLSLISDDGESSYDWDRENTPFKEKPKEYCLGSGSPYYTLPSSRMGYYDELYFNCSQGAESNNQGSQYKPFLLPFSSSYSRNESQPAQLHTGKVLWPVPQQAEWNAEHIQVSLFEADSLLPVKIAKSEGSRPTESLLECGQQHDFSPPSKYEDVSPFTSYQCTRLLGHEEDPKLTAQGRDKKITLIVDRPENESFGAPWNQMEAVVNTQLITPAAFQSHSNCDNVNERDFTSNPWLSEVKTSTIDTPEEDIHEPSPENYDQIKLDIPQARTPLTKRAFFSASKIDGVLRIDEEQVFVPKQAHAAFVHPRRGKNKLHQILDPGHTSTPRNRQSSGKTKNLGVPSGWKDKNIFRMTMEETSNKRFRTSPDRENSSINQIESYPQIDMLTTATPMPTSPSIGSAAVSSITSPSGIFDISTESQSTATTSSSVAAQSIDVIFSEASSSFSSRSTNYPTNFRTLGFSVANFPVFDSEDEGCKTDSCRTQDDSSHNQSSVFRTANDITLPRRSTSPSLVFPPISAAGPCLFGQWSCYRPKSNPFFHSTTSAFSSPPSGFSSTTRISKRSDQRVQSAPSIGSSIFL